MLKKTFFVLMAVCVLSLVLVGCGKKEAEVGIIEKIQKAGKIVVYTNPEFPPYEYLGENGKITGCEIELVNAIAAKLGVEAEIVSAEFDTILGSVQIGKADLGASGFTITPERAQLVTFSNPFDASVQYVIVPNGSEIKKLTDLAGLRIGGQQGTTGFMMMEDAIREGVLKDSGATVKAYNTAPDAVTAMKADQLDAVVIDKLLAMSLAKKNNLPCGELMGLGEVENFGMIVAKGNEALLDVVNDVIDQMQSDGSYDEAVICHQDITSAGK